MLPMRMMLRSFSSLIWSSTSSKCATAKTSSSPAKPMRLQEPRHESAQIEGQRNGCRYEKEQASHDLTAIQHCHPTSLVTSLCLVLTKNYQGYSEGSGVTDLLPLPLPLLLPILPCHHFYQAMAWIPSSPTLWCFGLPHFSIYIECFFFMHVYYFLALLLQPLSCPVKACSFFDIVIWVC